MSVQTISVSVIIPVFNNAKTILRALNSITDQTVQPQEIIIIDDASTDNSCDLIEQHIQTVPTARLLRSTSNTGPSASRNTGWATASGEYIAFLDADDAWHSKKLATQYSFMENNPEFVISGHEYSVRTSQESEEDIQVDDYEISVVNFRQFLIRNRYSTPTVMLRRSVTQRFDETQRFSEDYQLWLRIIATHQRGAFIKLPLTYLYKPPFGAGGISGRMFEMYRGELANARALRQQKMISFIGGQLWRTWLTVKFLIRLATRPQRRDR